jgi:hypothetical protein
MKMSLHVLNLEDDTNDAELNEAMLSARWPDCRFVRVDNRADFLAALAVSVHATRLKLYGRALVLRLCHELRK